MIFKILIIKFSEMKFLIKSVIMLKLKLKTLKIVCWFINNINLHENHIFKLNQKKNRAIPTNKDTIALTKIV